MATPSEEKNKKLRKSEKKILSASSLTNSIKDWKSESESPASTSVTFQT